MKKHLTVVIFHLLALAAVARLAHWPYPLVLLAIAVFILPLTLYAHFWGLDASRGIWDLPRSLAPLFPLYTLTALRLAVALIARASCPTCSATLTVPEPFASILSFEWAAIFALTLFIIHHSSFIISPAYHPRLAAFALATLGVIWVAILFPRLIPAGVTGADPYAY